MAWLALLGVILLIILVWIGSGTLRNYRRASAAVDHFHEQLDHENYAAIYQEASGEFHRASNEASTTQFLAKVHEKLGHSGKKSTAGFHVNWKNGRIFTDAVFNTQFALGQCQESFLWVEEGGELKLYGYNAESASLR